MTNPLPILTTNEEILEAIEIYGYWKLEWLAPQLRDLYVRKKTKGDHCLKEYLETKRKKEPFVKDIRKLRKILQGNSNRVAIVEIAHAFLEKLDWRERDLISIELVDDSLVMRKIQEEKTPETEVVPEEEVGEL